MNFKLRFYYNLRLLPTKKRRFVDFLFTSLFVHFFVLFFILKVGFRLSLPELVKAFEAKTQPLMTNNELLAALKPRKSDFGSFVFFDKPSEKIPQQMPEQEIKKQAATDTQPQEKIVEKKQTQAMHKKEAVAKQATPEKKLVQKEKPQSISHQKKQEQTPLFVKNDEQAKNKQATEEAEKVHQSLEDRIKKIEQTQQKVAALKEPAKDFSPLIKKQETIDPLPAPKKNIIAMTRGFLENRLDKGDDWLERKGDENKMPSFEELKYLSYEQRINWQLQASWKQNFERNFTARPLQGKAVVEFSINENGQLVCANIIQSSGMRELDDIILATMRHAAPFPPLPKHFNKTVYATGRIISVHAHMFGF